MHRTAARKGLLRPLPPMDLPFLVLVLTLVAFGLVMLCSASSAVALYRRQDAFAYVRPQLLYAAMGLVAMWTASRVDYHIYHKLAWPLLALSLVLLTAVLFMPEYNGCKRWLVLPGLGTLQPSEIAKFAVVLVFAHIIALNHDRMDSFAVGVAGYYQVKLEITSDEAETQDCPLNGIHDQDAAYIEVVKGEEKPLMAKAEVFLTDDSHEKIESGSVDVSKVSLFKMGVSLRTTENRSYEGHVSLISEDVDTKEEIVVNGISDEVSVSSAFDVPLYSYWLRKGNLSWTDGHTYLFRVMGEIGGKDVELKNPQEPSYYLKRKGDIFILYQDTATGIENATISDTETEICREGHQLLVSGKDVRKIKLYHAGGNLLRQASATDGKTVSLSLQGIRQGVYLLRVETGMQSKTYKLLL